MFKLIAISFPRVVKDEADVFLRLAQQPQISALHLRKPEWTESRTRGFLQQLSPGVLKKIRLHNHYGLINEFPLQGLHLTSLAVRPDGYTGPFSASCHSLQEVCMRLEQGCDYVFLSPVFDSISKNGYTAAFTHRQLRGADLSGVVALGGVNAQNLNTCRSLGFAGAALLGSLWGKDGRGNTEQNLKKILDQYEE